MGSMPGHKPTCPFCSFSVPSNGDEDMYLLMHHLELSHPENGTSPFIAFEDKAAPSQSQSSKAENVARSRTPSDPSEEEVYVDCPLQCGEAVTLAELSSHMELHGAESAALDDLSGSRSREASPHLHGGRASSTGPSMHLEVPTEAADVFSSALSKKPRPHSAHRRHRDGYGLRDWKELFLGSASKRTRATNSKPRTTAARRLGVSLETTRPSTPC